ncbi:MAG: 7-carboxy-7-deazaguanine synthase QueE [Acidimicrobiia bacterium]|nr:7-carboxy-7-deazaguanine synthase QueE [Acidimicrobiia bacterium]
MKIAEMFYSIQGEGTLVGVPSVFVRTSGCNLRCHWCDTPYTSWAPEGEEKTLEEIAAYARANSTGYTVVTGGEPMIAPEIVELTRRLRAAGEHITIETAGTVFAEVDCDLMSISPKLANSTPLERDGGRWAGQHERLRWKPAVVKRLMGLCAYQLKFVVVEPEDLEEVREMAAEVGAAPDRVVLMPEGVDAETLRERSGWLSEACKREGYRFTPRLHVILYGNRRGV